MHPFTHRQTRTEAAQRGLTLIELVAVLTLLAVLTAVAGLSLRGPHRTLKMQDVVDRLRFEDELARRQAMEHGLPVELVWDLDGQQVQRRTDVSHPDAMAGDAMSWTLPSGYRIERVLVPNQASTTRQVAIRCSMHGRSQSYALLVQGPADTKTNSSSSQWLLVAGLSGHSQTLEDEREINRLLLQLSANHGE